MRHLTNTRIVLSTLVIAVVAFTLCGCRPGAPPSHERGGVAVTATPPPARGGTVVIGEIRDVESWNPYLSDHDVTNDVLALIFPSLAIEQPDYREHPPSFTPNLAESWQWSDDHLVLTMQLRQEATWSDGVPVTAADVVFTLRAQTSPEVAWSSAYIKDSISTVEAVDGKTVRFVFTHHYPYQMMDVNDGLILPAHAWSTIPFADWHGTDWQEHALGAGPFRLAAHTPHQEIVLERNDSYWKTDRPLLDRLVLRIVPDHTSLLTQLQTGDIDIISVVPPHQAQRVAEAPETELLAFPDRCYTYVGWNNSHPILADRRVRRALTMAIDRQAIIDTVLAGHGSISVGPILTTMWAFNTSLQPLPYDPEAARGMLAEAGWRDSDGDGVLDHDGTPFAIELLTHTESQSRRDIGIMVQEQLRKVGIGISIRTLEWGALLSLLEKNEFDAYVGRWVEPTQIDLQDLWQSTDPDEPYSNFIRYANPEVDRLIDEAATEADFRKQKPLLERIQEIITDDQPYTFLYERESLVGISTRIHGAVINDATFFFNVEDWYVDRSGSK